MSLFKRALSSFGIGACRVDTLLEEASYCAGDPLPARVMIYGGDVSQSIDGIYFSIHCSYRQSPDEKPFSHTSQLAHCQLNEPLTIEAGAELELPVTLSLPDFTPLSDENTKLWLHTGLDIALAQDPDDQDVITVGASSPLAEVLSRLAALGWQSAGSYCEHLPDGRLQQVLLLDGSAGGRQSLQLKSWRQADGQWIELGLPELDALGVRQLMGRHQRVQKLCLDEQTTATLALSLEQGLAQLLGQG